MSTTTTSTKSPMSLPASTNHDSPGSDSNYCQGTSQLSGEIHSGPVRALDEEIIKQEEVLVELKRTRNSLLNINKLPPEILGGIFQWNVMLKGDYGGLEKESHNFLLVCHYWFQVASHTPELWSFWGNTPKDWARFHSRSKSTSLDLVLEDYDGNCYDDGSWEGEGVHFNWTLADVLQDRASRDTIRRVHLVSGNMAFLDSIISSLTSEGGEGRFNQMESFVLWYHDAPESMDLSDFFARHHFPKLRRLELFDCAASSLDHLISETKTLTKFSIAFTNTPTYPSHNPTTPQLLSILKSNPLLQKVILLLEPSPYDHSDVPSFRVPLHHLRDLKLSGDPRQVFSLLDQLDHPAVLDEFSIRLSECPVTEISRKIGPYFRAHFKRRGRSQSGLRLDVLPDFFEIRVGNAPVLDPSFPTMDNLVCIFIHPDERLSGDESRKTTLELLAYLPLDEIVYFHQTLVMGQIYARLPNLRTLHLCEVPLPAAFLENEDILQHLENLNLERLIMDGRRWNPLRTFLAHRASSGKRLKELEISRSDDMGSRDAEIIKGIVEEFNAAEVLRLIA